MKIFLVAFLQLQLSRKKLLKALLHKNFASKMLMKLTPEVLQRCVQNLFPTSNAISDSQTFWRVTNFDILTENNKFQHFREKKMSENLLRTRKVWKSQLFVYAKTCFVAQVRNGIIFFALPSCPGIRTVRITKPPFLIRYLNKFVRTFGYQYQSTPQRPLRP